MQPYIPNADQAAADWMENFTTLLTAAPATYGLLAGDASACQAASNAYIVALLIATNPATRTSPTIADKDAAKASALFIIRPYAVQISLNTSVGNMDKVAIGVTVRSNTPTPIPSPVVAPTIEFLGAIPLQQQLQIRQPGSTSKAKPEGCIGIQVARTVGTVAATDPNQLTVIGTYGKTPMIQTFGAEDQGKKVTYAARYVTRSGPAGVSQAGPWSALLTVVVI